MSAPIPHPKVFASSQTPPWGVEVAGDGFWLTPPRDMLDGEIQGRLEHDGLEVERFKVTRSGIRKVFVFCGYVRHLTDRTGRRSC